MANEEEEFDLSGIHPLVKYGLAVLLILGLIDSFLSGRFLIGIIAAGISWFFSGPQCAKWAKKENHSQTWAFFIGVIFSLLGVLVYWLYIRRFLSLILGGVSAILISIFFLILITITKLPVIFPNISQYSDRYGILGSLIWFALWFIFGVVITYLIRSQKITP